MNSFLKEIARMIRGSLPFTIVNSNPENDLSKMISYRSSSEAQAAGKSFIIDVNGDLPIKVYPTGKNSVSSSSLNAYKVIIVDLDNQDCVWDWQKAKHIIKNTSWYNELNSLPPIHGFFIIDNAQNNIHWVDRDSPTLDIYMTFDGTSAGKIVGPNTNLINSISFLDFKLMIGVNGNLIEVDFLTEQTKKWSSESSTYYWDQNIANRNSGTGTSIKLKSDISNSFNNTNIKEVSIGRVSTGQVDLYKRPLHNWIASTAGTTCIYVPTDDNGDELRPEEEGIYEYNPAEMSYGFVNSIGRKKAAHMYYSTILLLGVEYTINSKNYENWTTSSPHTTTYTYGSRLPFTNSATPSSIDIYDDRNIIIGSDEGMAVFMNYDKPNRAEGAHWARILTTSTYSTPLMKGRVNCAYPLNDLNDAGGQGYTLSNIDSVAFTGTSPLGFPCAVFDGVNDRLERTGISISNASNGNTWSLYFKSNKTVGDLPLSSVESILQWADSITAPTGQVRADIHTDGTFRFYFGAGSEDFVNSSINVLDGKWHHVACTDDREGNIYAYIDGILFSHTTPVNNNGNYNGQISIGAKGDQFNPFSGEIANVTVSNTPWTEKEVMTEYSRMVDGLNGYTSLLTATDIDSIRVDDVSGKAIVCAGNVAHIIDAENFMVYETHTLDTSGILNDADIVSVKNGEDTHYVLAGSDSVKQISSNIRIDK